MKEKTKLTRLCSILLTLALLVGLLPTVALAADATADFVTDPTAAEALLGSGASWNNTTTTLTLNGVNFTTSAATAVKLPDGAIIELNGANTITSTYSGSGDCYGIYGAGSLTIQGTGTLNVTSGTPNNLSFGIHAEGSVTINSGAVTATGGVAGEQSYGIRALHGDLTIKGGTVTATGGNAKESSGLWAGNNSLVISGGKVVAQGGNVSGTSSGIFANKVVIKNTGSRIPHVTTRGGNGVRSYGIFVYGSGKSVTISGGAVIAKAGSATSSAAALSEVSTLPTTYWWRTSDSGDYFKSSNTAYTGDGSAAHLEIWNLDPTATADFTSGDGTAALALLNTAKTGAADSTWAGDGNGNYTLTLNGVNFTTTAATAVILPANTTIVLNGVNTITGGDSDLSTCNGIYALGSLTIRGSGTLTVTGGNSSVGACYGIYGVGGLTIRDSGTLTVTGGNAFYSSYGIYAYPCSVTIDGGIVTAKGGETTNYDSYGIAANTVTINGGTVTAKGGTAKNRSSGIYANNDVTISGGTANVTATGGAATGTEGERYSYGIYAGTNVEISGDTVEAKGGAATGTEGESYSYGIYAKTGVTISGGNVTAQSGTAINRSYSIYAKTGNISVTGATTEVTATSSAANYSYGIDAHEGSITIENSKVTATGGAAGENGAGIYAKTDVTISGTANVTAEGGTAGNNSYGIEASAGDVIISGSAEVTAKGGAAHKSYGIYADDGSVTIENGTGTVTVNADGGTANGQGGDSYGIYADNVSISGGDVTANGGTALKNYGIYATYMGIMGGKVTATAVTANNESYGIYIDAGTRTLIKGTADVTATGGTVTESGGKSYGIYANPANYSYVYIQEDAKVTATSGTVTGGYNDSINYVSSTGPIITFDANGGSGGKMMYAEGTAVSYDYTLPANGFTAPAGKQFKGWATALNGSVISGTSITVTGNTTLYAIWENTKDLSSIAITTPPTKTTYTVGESFDTAGMVVKATYSDSTTAAVTGYTVSPDRALTTSDTSVTITYTEGGVTKTATQAITVNPAAPTGGGIYIPPTYKVESELSEDADGSVTFSKASAKKGDTVTITVTPDRYYKTSGVIVKDASGRMIAVTDNGNGTFTFQMPDSKVTVEPVFSWDNPFVDVAGDAYYAPAVEWALKNDITNGTSATTFSPNAGCTRGQIVTFLWRAAGCPEPAGMSSFTDVSADAYYAKAVAWAAEQGITGGTGDGKFSPDAVCTRGQIVTFLWRAEKSPAVGTANPFTDVEADAYYAGATNWAVENSITEGTGDGTTFSPANDCTRAQIVTFLYRYFVK